MKLVENNETLKDKIINIESLASIQWWLYRGALTRQPLSVDYYKTWTKLHNSFYLIIESIENDSADNSFSQKLKVINNELIAQKTILANHIAKDSYDELCTAIDKLTDYINSIIKELN